MFGRDFKGFPSSTSFLKLCLLGQCCHWCCEAGLEVLSSSHLCFLGLSLLGCTMGRITPPLPK